MNEQRIKKSIETGVLQLSFWLKLNHYGASIFFFLIEVGLLAISFPIYHPIDLFQIVILSIFPLLGIWFFFRKRKKLKFRIIEKKISSKQIHQISSRVATQFDWSCRLEQASVILFESNTLSGAGLITIIITDKNILINSICNPYGRFSATSLGWNKLNVKTLLDKIRDAENLN